MDSEQDTPGSDNLTVAFKKEKKKTHTQNTLLYQMYKM